MPNDTPFLEAAMQRFRLASDAEADIRQKSLDDLRFSIGDQWPINTKANRDRDRRPCLVLNRIPQFIRHVTNEQRQQRPSIQINPRGGDATVESAQILQGMVRHIEISSEAKIAYDHAFDMMCRIGFGYFRVRTDYSADADDIEQDIFIERIKNPFSVYIDPFANEADYSDAKWAFIVEDLSEKQFKLEHPDSEFAAMSLNDFTNIGNKMPGWATAETIRVAEYYYVEEKKEVLYVMSDGGVARSLEERQLMEGIGLQVVDEHEKIKRNIKWAKITAMDVLETNDWAGRYIPIVPVIGEDVDVDGKRHISGMVRNAKDPQRMLNYWASHATEAVALAPKAPFIAAEGQIEGHEPIWENANRGNYSVLPYKPVELSGRALPPPQRQTAEPAIQAILAMQGKSEDDLKATMGIYDDSLGERGVSQSGRAILARQRQSNIATLNYADNLARSIGFCARIVVDLIPHIYDTPRILRIVNPDSTGGNVVVFKGQGQQEAAQQMQTEKIRRAFDVSAGRYDVTISVGPSFQSRRQEAVASQLEFLKVYPEAGPLIADLVAGNMDWPGAEEVAKRLKKALPPNMQEGGEDQEPEVQLQQMQAKFMQIEQMNEQLTQALKESTETIRTKKMELESKERIAERDNENKLVLAKMQESGAGALAMLQASLSNIDKRLDLLRQNEPIVEEETPQIGV